MSITEASLLEKWIKQWKRAETAGINTMVTADIISSDDRTALIDKATVLISVLQKEGGLAVPALCDIEKARA